MIFKKLLLVLGLLTFSLTGFSHEGHDSAVAKSIHGGTVKKSKNAFVEVLQDEGIEIYISSHDYKNLITPTFVVTAFADVKGKKIPLQLASKKTHYVVVTDLKKEKHFKLNVLMKFNGVEESVTFPLEN